MRIIWSIWFLTWAASHAFAHNPLTAKVELRSDLSTGALLNIYTSQAGLHQAILAYYGEVEVSHFTQLAYKKAVVQYLKNHVDIVVDNKPLILGEGAIKLGNHQTDLTFIIEHFPEEIQFMDVHIKAFQENDGHHTMFLWKTFDGKVKRVLSSANDFKASIKEDSMNTSISEGSEQWMTLLLYSLSLIGLILILRDLYAKNRLGKLSWQVK